jgi:3-oxoacyl-[acyl-carrier protein] reductase
LSPPRALVTGGSRGIGLAVAQALAQRGWRLGLIARDATVLAAACAQLPGDGHEWFALDVADEAAWGSIAPRLEKVDGVVCAAAVLTPVGPLGSYGVDDFRRTLEVNVVGTLLAIGACLPALRESGGAVVTFSGGGATAPLPRYDAYAASKAAVVRLTENLAVELRGAGVRLNCIAPGFVPTEIHEATLAAGAQLAGTDYHRRTVDELQRGGFPATEAAELACLLLAPDPPVPFTGRLISAQWDPWREASFHARLAAEPELATIRRIDGMRFAAVEERTNE